ncbi:Uncharacterised protein [Klebsiella pneumoniae]|nr:Uncharacterised protein [Klebsiella pneumoniae]
MDEKEVNFSLSYEQLTRIAEERIRDQPRPVPC